jgi:hypothetical protein
MEYVPFYPLDMKYFVAHMWSGFGSQELDQQAVEDENMECYPLDIEL